MQKTQKNGLFSIARRALPLLMCFGLFFGASIAQEAQAEIPVTFGFQGRLKNASGNPLSSTFSITFRLYDASSGGTAVWTETHPSVTTDQGFFSVRLGSVTPFPISLDFNKALYLSTQVASDAEMSPRLPLNTVPYAYTAGGINALDSVPVSATGGRMFYNTAAGTLNYYDHTASAWRSLGTSSGTLQQVTDGGNVTTNAIQFAGGTSTAGFVVNGSGVTTTNLFASGVVSTTQLYVAGSLVCLATGTNCPSSTTVNLQTVTNAGNTTTNAIVFAGGTSTNAFVFENTLTVLGDTSLQAATATTFAATFASTSQLYISGQLACLANATNCPAFLLAESDTLATVTARGNFATTTLELYGGFLAASSTVTSTLTVLGDTNVQALFFTGASGSSVTTTNLFAASATVDTLELSNALPVASGGTGHSATPAYGQLLVGDGSGYTLTPTSSLGLDLSSISQANIIGTPDEFDTLEKIYNGLQSAGITSGGTITDNGNGTVNIAAGEALLRGAASATATLYSLSFNAQNNISLTDNSVNYISLDFNGGSPIFVVGTTVSSFNCMDRCIAYVVTREGTTLNIVNAAGMNLDGNRKERRRLFETQGFQHVAGGSILGESGVRNITVTAGAFYYSLNRVDHGAFDTSATSTFAYYYRNGAGGWTRTTGNTQIDNTRYDDGSGTLATLSNNRYGVFWVYILNSNPSTLAVQYGQGDYANLATAQAATVPTAPPAIQGVGVLIGRVIIRRDATVFAATESAFAKQFVGDTATEHNELAGLQGGTTNEYFHLTNTEYTGTGSGVFVRATNPSLAGFISTASSTISGGLTFLNATGTNVTTTNLFVTNGSFTTLTAGSFALTDLVWTNATGTNTTSTNLFTTNLQTTNALLANATATWLGFVTASGTTLNASSVFVNGQAVCLANGTNCPASVESDTLATVTARGSFATTTLELYGGFLAASSTVTSTLTVLGSTSLQGLAFTNATGTNVTTTNLFASGVVSTTELYVAGSLVCLASGTNCPAGGGITTLDTAYDAGGSGAGRSIFADSGAVQITVPSTSTSPIGLIVNGLRDNFDSVVQIYATGTDLPLFVQRTNSTFDRSVARFVNTNPNGSSISVETGDTAFTFQALNLVNGGSGSLNYQTATGIGQTLNINVRDLNIRTEPSEGEFFTAFGLSKEGTLTLTASSSAVGPGFELHGLGSGAAFRVNDESGDTTPFLIDASGNVGIGTDAPSRKLQVVGTTLTQGLEFTNATGTNATTTNLFVSGTVSTSQLFVGGYQVCLSNGTNCPTGGGITSLDTAYDAGGSGAGRSIFADSGAVQITVPSTSTSPIGLRIDGLRDNFGTVVQIYSTGTDEALFVQRSETSFSGDTIARFSNPNDHGAAGASVIIDNANIGLRFTAGSEVNGANRSFIRSENVNDGTPRTLQFGASSYIFGVVSADAAENLFAHTLDALGQASWITSSTLTGDAYLFTNRGSGLSFRVNDELSDATPFVIDASGNVGIGTDAPTHKLTIDGSVSSTGVVFHNALSASEAGDDALCIHPTTGEIRRAVGATDCTLSSARFKRDIESLAAGLDALMDLRPVSFKMDGSDDARLGFIAEEVAAIEPRLVFYETDGQTPRGVRYAEITSLLVKSVQEQQAMIKALQESRAEGLTFHSTASFLKGIVVKEHLYAGQDIAGHAKLISGATRVRVAFDKTFLHQPIVTATPLDFVDSMYRVTDVTIEGFTIQVNAAQSNDKVFAWHAIGSDGGKIFSSDGTTEDIQPIEPDPDEIPVEEPPIIVPEPESEPESGQTSELEPTPATVEESEPTEEVGPEPIVEEPLTEGAIEEEAESGFEPEPAGESEPGVVAESVPVQEPISDPEPIPESEPEPTPVSEEEVMME